MDARRGQPQVVIKQVILYHALECNYDESRLEEPASDPTSMTITSHHPLPCTTITVINEDRELSEPRALNIEFLKKSSSSKSQLSLSNLEINVFCVLLILASISQIND
jgi:hypothetical protein